MEKGEKAGRKNRGISLETGAYEVPPPKPFAWIPHREFLEYDRRQVTALEGGGMGRVQKGWMADSNLRYSTEAN